MAQRTIVLLSDDLDGSEATDTISFGLDGRTYEIDLNDAHAEELRSFLERYTAAGRRTAGGPGRKAASTSTRSKSTGPKQDTAAIREWAKTNGFELAERGRIPGHIQEAYHKANA
ncbi:Lsr2 family protein [Streptomyces sp. NPDC057363]|uniref:histone-like nucleoid-structuring protein Lsr2 n=1 Tax=Streptomyces sp. NPDC057363 TaxID=3346107 RepID=UPI00363F8FFC